MQVIQLKAIDQKLAFLNPSNDEGFSFSGVSIAGHISDDTLLFVKDKKFCRRVLDAMDKRDFQNLGLVIARDFWNETELQDVLKNRFRYILGVEDVTLFMTNLSELLYREKFKNNTVPRPSEDFCGVMLGENVVLGKNVTLYPGVVIMDNVEIGDETVVLPNVTIYSGVSIGRRCRIHSGTVLGSDGFGYNFYNGVHLKVWHTGGVIIEDHVEIGANACIDTGTFTPTIVREGTKIDNQVQVAHNVELGQGTILCGQVGVAGSVNIGPYAVLGGQVGVTHDVTIGSQAQVGGFSAVTSNIEGGSTVAGTPARPIKEWLAGLAYVRKNSIKKRS